METWAVATGHSSDATRRRCALTACYCATERTTVAMGLTNKTVVRLMGLLCQNGPMITFTVLSNV